MNKKLTWIAFGAISLIVGIVALFNPFAATIAAERIAAWAFLVLGGLQLISAFRSTGWAPRLWTCLLGVFGLIVGISLFTNPMAGVISLTMLLATMFLATGLVKIVVSFRLRPSRLWTPVLVSGVISTLLAAMIFTDFPVAATTVLGILLGVELISNGISLIALGSTLPTQKI